MEHFTPTPLEWTHLASACRAVAEKERERAAAIGGRAARDYIISAEEYERLAERCTRMARP
jgi:hypothetical protein